MFRRISVYPLTSDWRPIAVAIIEVKYLQNGVYCLLSLLSSLLWRPTPASFEGRGRGRGRGAAGVEKMVGPISCSESMRCYKILGGSHVRFPKVGRGRTRATRAVAAPMGRGNDEHFSQLTKQCYFTAKIMLRYCSGEYFWSQVTSKIQRSKSNLKKLRNTFIPVYNRYIHSKPTQKQWVVPCWLHWLLQWALCCYQTAKARTLCVYIRPPISLSQSWNFYSFNAIAIMQH